MDTSKIIKEFIDMFDIPDNQKLNIENCQQEVITFDSLTDEVSEQINTVLFDNKDNKEVIKKDDLDTFDELPSAKEINKMVLKNKKKKNNKKDGIKKEKDVVVDNPSEIVLHSDEEIFSTDTLQNIEESKDIDESVLNINSEDISQEAIINKIEIINNEIQWVLKSPSKLYDNFYKMKKELISEFLPGGHRPFERWTKELIECNVNMTSEVFDNKFYASQMDQIQQFMYRIKNIQIQCNNQYFMWELFIENMKGCLARVEYIKPSIKQEGLIHEHMRDIIWYFAQLKHIHESAKIVMKTLEKAWETISRKATISIPLPTGDKYYNYNKENVIPSNTDLNSYDVLPNNAKVVNKTNNNSEGFCAWEEIK